VFFTLYRSQQTHSPTED